jgi:HEPN domain-containing protein
MKLTTKEWLSAAEDDLISAKKLVDEIRLTNIVAFHCQQCIEKGFKALIEEILGTSVKSHDLLRLKETANMFLSDAEMILLATINEVYIDARYPGDMGLMPQGKPTIAEAKRFILFSQFILERITSTIGS